MAATEYAAARWRRLAARLVQCRGGHAVRIGLMMGGTLAAGGAHAVDLPENRADAMMHVYDGGGLRASGPALLVRKKVMDTVSLSGSYYVDTVSSASIDVVTSASPYKEKRNEYTLGADYTVRDTLLSISASSSKEPDYTAEALNLDVSQEVFGGMSTIAFGFTHGNDHVGKKDTPGFADNAKHWRYRLGLTQILSPRWLATANIEVVSDAGFLGNPYRVARVFGAAVPERMPRTRSSRAIKFRILGDIGSGASVHTDYRYFWDNWEIKAHTFEFGGTRHLGEKWLGDAYGRYHKQNRALFYSDNAQTETAYVTRNRQLSTFNTFAVGGKVSYQLRNVPGQYELRLNGAYERVRFNFSDFTDLRSGSPYSMDANVLQLFLSANF